MGVKVRQRKKGEWWVFIDHKGRRKASKVGSKEAAKAVARKIEEALAAGKLDLEPQEAPKSPLFEEYAKRWMAGHVGTNLKPSTRRNYKLLLDTFLLPEFGKRPIDSISRDEIKALCYRAIENGRVRPRKREDGSEEKGLSARSVSLIVRALSAIFNQAIEDGIIAANPALRPGRFIKTGPRRDKIDILTPEEGRAFLDAARKYHARHYPILAAALYTGARQGELLALQWGDVDWRGKFIEVRRASWEGHVSTPKSGKGRRVDLSDSLAGILSEHRRKLSAEVLKAGRNLPEWVFPSVA